MLQSGARIDYTEDMTPSAPTIGRPFVPRHAPPSIRLEERQGISGLGE